MDNLGSLLGIPQVCISIPALHGDAIQETSRFWKDMYNRRMPWNGVVIGDPNAGSGNRVYHNVRLFYGEWNEGMPEPTRDFVGWFFDRRQFEWIEGGRKFMVSNDDKYVKLEAKLIGIAHEFRTPTDTLYLTVPQYLRERIDEKCKDLRRIANKG